MIDIYPITNSNAADLGPLYEDFRVVAEKEYGWPLAAIDFAGLHKIISVQMLQGYLIKDFQENRYIGFMLYQIEAYRSLEIKVIYLEKDVSIKLVLDNLMNRFLEEIQPNNQWDVLSYPVLGEGQSRYVDFITWYGFNPVGQAVVKFHIFDALTLEIFKLQTFTPPPEGYSFVMWDPQYEEGVIDVLTETFSASVDALWDPRFRSRDGIKEALAFVKSGGYGIFWPSCTTILLNAEKKPVGVCLFNVVSRDEANIPLIGLLKSERNHKLGRSLLAATVDRCVQEVLQEKLSVKTISATVATSNIPAVRMYRHTGFQEDYWYPHVYQERSNVLARKANQWC